MQNKIDCSMLKNVGNKFLIMRNKEKVMRTFVIVLCSVMLIGLAGCNNIRNRDVGTAVGAGVGGVLGHQLSGGNVAATVGGAVVGGVAGHYIGKQTEK